MTAVDIRQDAQLVLGSEGPAGRTSGSGTDSGLAPFGWTTVPL